MQKQRALLFFVAILVLFVVPVIAVAQGLVPCAGAADCNLCAVGQLMKNVINFFIGFSVSIAAAMFAYAGVLYLTGGSNPSQIERAHKIFKNVLIGFLIAISAWLVVQTLLSVVFDGKFWVGGNWNQLQCVKETTTNPNGGGRIIGTNFGQLINQVLPSGSPSSGAPATTGNVDTSGGTASGGGGTGSYTHDIAYDSLTSRGICVSSSGSTECVSNPSVTSLEGLHTNTVLGAIYIKQTCNCDVTITGGTEGGVHAEGTYSHANGYKLDFRTNSGIDSFIEGWGQSGTRGTEPVYTSASGNIYCALESDHWDCTFR